MNNEKYLLVGDGRVLIGEFDSEEEANTYWTNRYKGKGYDWTWDYYSWEIIPPNGDAMFGCADVLISEKEYLKERKRLKENEAENEADIEYDEIYKEWFEDEKEK